MASHDRRVRKTRQALQHALIELMLDKGYEAVTVQDIIDRADVGRSTFYAHFADKEGLFKSGIEDLRTELRQACATPTGDTARLFGFSLPMFRHCHDHQRLYWALVGKHSGTLMLRWFAQILTELVNEELAAPPTPRVETPVDLVVQFIVGAYLSLLTWWIENGAEHSPEDMDRRFRELATPGVTATLGLGQS